MLIKITLFKLKLTRKKGNFDFEDFKFDMMKNY